jgi:hypothetical protein
MKRRIGVSAYRRIGVSAALEVFPQLETGRIATGLH